MIAWYQYLSFIFENIFQVRWPSDHRTVCLHVHSEPYDQFINHFHLDNLNFSVKKGGPELEYAMNHYANQNQCYKPKSGKIQHQMLPGRFVKFWTTWHIFEHSCQKWSRNFCIEGINARKLKEFKLLENIMTSIFCMRIFY